MKIYYQNDYGILYQGNCLQVMEWLEVLGEKVDLILADPPYGITACEWDIVIPLDKMWTKFKRIRKDSTVIALFGTESFSSYLRISNIKEFKYDWIWVKNMFSGFVNVKFMPLKAYEIISIFYKKNLFITHN